MKKLKSIKSLQKKAEALWKEYCYLRDGRQCMVKKYFGGSSHNDVFQVDHCFSRANKNLFLDTRNGTVVCSTCNASKNWDKKSVGRLIDDIVKMREGEEAFTEMKEIDMRGSPNLNWHSRAWLEDMVIQLTLKCSELMEGKSL